MKYFTMDELDEIARELLENPCKETLKRLYDKYNGSLDNSSNSIELSSTNPTDLPILNQSINLNSNNNDISIPILDTLNQANSNSEVNTNPLSINSNSEEKITLDNVSNIEVPASKETNTTMQDFIMPTASSEIGINNLTPNNMQVDKKKEKTSNPIVTFDSFTAPTSLNSNQANNISGSSMLSDAILAATMAKQEVKKEEVNKQTPKVEKPKRNNEPIMPYSGLSSLPTFTSAAPVNNMSVFSQTNNSMVNEAKSMAPAQEVNRQTPKIEEQKQNVPIMPYNGLSSLPTFNSAASINNMSVFSQANNNASNTQQPIPNNMMQTTNNFNNNILPYNGMINNNFNSSNNMFSMNQRGQTIGPAMFGQIEQQTNNAA